MRGRTSRRMQRGLDGVTSMQSSDDVIPSYARLDKETHQHAGAQQGAKFPGAQPRRRQRRHPGQQPQQPHLPAPPRFQPPPQRAHLREVAPPE